MTHEEAIKYIKYCMCIGRLVGNTKPIIDEKWQAGEMAIEALEHDMPMKVQIEEWIDTKCPNGCGYILSTHHGDGYYSIDKKIKFCPRCGQRLDWNDEKEDEE